MATIGAKRYDLVEVKSLEGGAMRLRFETDLDAYTNPPAKTGITVHLTPDEANAVVNWQDSVKVS